MFFKKRKKRVDNQEEKNLLLFRQFVAKELKVENINCEGGKNEEKRTKNNNSSNCHTCGFDGEYWL